MRPFSGVRGVPGSMSQEKTPKVSGFVGSFSPAVAPVNEASLVGAVSRRVAHAHIVVVLVVPVWLVRVHLLEQRERHSAHANQNEEKDDLLHGPRHSPRQVGSYVH